jgi:hypothetical protein
MRRHLVEDSFAPGKSDSPVIHIAKVKLGMILPQGEARRSGSRA